MIKLIPPDKKKIQSFVNLVKLKKYQEERTFGPYYYIHYIEELPSCSDRSYKIQGETVNLYRLTCSCKDFREKDGLYEERDIRRICKHIYFKLSSSSVSREISEITHLLAKSAAIYSMEHFYKLGDQDIYYGFKKGSSLVNIIAPLQIRKSYYRFVYDPVSHRWSYGNVPEESDEIIQILKQIIQYQLPFKHPFINLLESSDIVLKC